MPDLALSAEDQEQFHALTDRYLDLLKQGKVQEAQQVMNEISALIQKMTVKYAGTTALPKELGSPDLSYSPADANFAMVNMFAPLLHDGALLSRAHAAYGAIRPLATRRLDFWEKVLAPLRRDDITAGTRDQLELSFEQYSTTEQTYLGSITAMEKDPSVGPMHPKVADRLSELAEIDRSQRAYDKAEARLRRALAIREKSLGSSHPDVAAVMTQLGEVYQEWGAYGKAEPLLRRALAILERAHGPKDATVAATLHGLGLLYKDRGTPANAEPVFLRALEILETRLGPRHPQVAICLDNLAELYAAQGAPDKAEHALSRAADIREAQLDLTLLPLSEARKRAIMELLETETEAIVSLQADATPARAPGLALTTVLRRKGRVLDSLAGSQLAVRDHLTPELRAKLEQLVKERGQFARSIYDDLTADLQKYGQGMAGRTSRPGAPPAVNETQSPMAIANEMTEHYKARWTAQVRIADLEAALATASAGLKIPSDPLTIAKVQAALPRDAALIELVRYHRFDPSQVKQPWREGRYVAYILMADGPAVSVSLGPTAPIDAAVDAVLAEMRETPRLDAARAALQDLDARLFAPIRAKLPPHAHVILAPDGKLNLVPFEALLDRQGHYALENRLITYATSGRDLLALAAARAPQSPAVIVANPAFGPIPARPLVAAFTPLPGTAQELADLQHHFGRRPLAQSHATKTAIQQLIGPAVLHIATHGFYVNSGLSSHTKVEAVRGMSVQLSKAPDPAASSMTRERSAAPAWPDPSGGLDAAGIALAGANQGAAGIITAHEFANLDWRGTQLVVLSACETGVGEVPSGDGVFGMRRAITLAGASSQVVTLWRVSDASTRDLMRTFYAEMARGTGRAEALRQAQLHLLRQAPYAHPYYWAGFVLAGDWRALPHGAIRP